MLADGEDVEPRLVGQSRLRQHLAKTLARRQTLAGHGVRGDIAEAVDAELHETVSREVESAQAWEPSAILPVPPQASDHKVKEDGWA
jgi:hypothetical protein